VFASILNSGTNGVNIPFDSFNAADVRKTVRLRNINFNGVDTGANGIRITGGAVIAAGTVLVEDCLIDGNFAGSARGISDERTGGGELYVSNTTVRNTGTFGIDISPAVAGQRIDAAFDNIRVQNTNNIGIFVGNNGRVMINRSVITGNVQIGLGVSGLQAASQVNISNSVVSNNGLGIGNLGGTVTLRVSNNDISFNNTAIGSSNSSVSGGMDRVGHIEMHNAQCTMPEHVIADSPSRPRRSFPPRRPGAPTESRADALLLRSADRWASRPSARAPRVS